MKRILFAIVIHFFIYDLLQAQELIPLYNEIPNSKPGPNKEKSVVTGGILRISKVSVPAMTLYKPVSQNSKKTAVVICPGGGYGILAASHEGSDVARLFNEWGITVFVLKYR